MLPSFASVEELADRIPGGIENSDLARAVAALDDASSLIRDEAGKSWVTEEGDLALPTGVDAWRADTLVRVCCSAARRSIENPEGVSQESLGGYSVTNSNASADVYLTSGERRSVKRAAGRESVWAMPLTRSIEDAPDVIDCVNASGEPAGTMPFTYEPLT